REAIRRERVLAARWRARRHAIDELSPELPLRCLVPRRAGAGADRAASDQSCRRGLQELGALVLAMAHGAQRLACVQTRQRAHLAIDEIRMPPGRGGVGIPDVPVALQTT